MSEFKYKVSVIVPVYNVEQYIDACMESLAAQSLPMNEFEIIFINDGSTDGSLEKCKMYEGMYDNVVVYTKENGGVGSARNVGIDKANGKYLLYLDADDVIIENTIEKVIDFFDRVYDEVDLCTYKIVSYVNGKPQPLHYRYDYLKASGIYDLEKYALVTQTTMNIVVKNNKEIYFDTDLSYGEDQKYISNILLRKNRIGYCAEGEYRYIKRDDSAVAMEAYSYYLYEQKMDLFESLFSMYGESVPRYVQGIVLANWSWELTSDCILPYHYKGKDFDDAINRIKNIIDRIDIDLILEHPKIDVFHKHYWISLKRNVAPTVLVDGQETSIWIDGKNIYKKSGIEIVFCKIRIENGKLYLLAFIKSPIFNYIEKPILWVEEDDKEREIEVFDSIKSCYKTRMKTNQFWGFAYECKASLVSNFRFLVEIDGIKLETFSYLMPDMVFNHTLGISEYFRDSYKLSFNENIFSLEYIEPDRIDSFERNRKFNGIVENNIYNLRDAAIAYRSKKRVWLYVDSYTVKKDNAYYQFQADFYRKDGVERWYVYDGEVSDIEYLFDNRQADFVVKYGSQLHKLLYIASEYVLASFSDRRPRIPFVNDAEYSYYRDICKAQTIYLQHGVCHADLRYTQSAECCKVDKIVVSSFFELENFEKRYHYRKEDLIPVGMPRYDFINPRKQAKNRILFAPSWRSYLLGRGSSNKWAGSEKRLVTSEYYQKFSEFLTSDTLIRILEENDLYLDAKLHQNMKDTLQLFDFQSERVRLVDEVEIEDYKLFITDISSYVFDYAYLNRAIMYFMPDMEKFESGMNHYRKLDLPFEEAFGNVCFEVDQAIDEIKRIIENNFEVEDVYRQRMKDFFLPLNKCRDSLYNYLFKEKL